MVGLISRDAPLHFGGVLSAVMIRTGGHRRHQDGIAALDESGADLQVPQRRCAVPTPRPRELADAVLDAERSAGAPCSVGIGTPARYPPGLEREERVRERAESKPVKPDLSACSRARSVRQRR
jgi:hypothetical protein